MDLYAKREHDEFPFCLLNSETLNEYSSAIVHVLSSNEIRNSDERKVAMLELLRYLVRPPSINFPFEITSSNILDAVSMANNFIYQHLASKEAKYLIAFTVALLEINTNFDRKNEVLTFVINHFTSEVSNEGTEFLQQLWKKRNNISLSHENVERLAVNLPLCVEETLIKMCQETLESDMRKVSDFQNQLEKIEVSCLIDVCSNSACVFKISTGILHELLILSRAHSGILIIVSEFVKAVLLRKKSGIIDLFPPEYRMLAMMLNIEPDLYPQDNQDKNFNIALIVSEMKNKMVEDKRAVAMLVSYFPKWLYVPHKIYGLVNSASPVDRNCWLYLLDCV